MTTPYALFAHVPLSECRQIVRLHQRMRQPSDYAARVHIYAHYCERALAAASNQLKLVTAERDELRQECTDLLAEIDALQFAATQAGRERDAMRGEL